MPLNKFISPDEIPKNLTENFFDAIVVLGGGVPLSPNDPPPYVQARCKFAAQVYESSSNKPKILTLSAGTAHLPQLLSSDGLPVWESTASASFLMNHLNIPAQDVYAETTSYDTISNAFFTRTNFCDIVGWKRLLIITNEFHMMRTKYIFDWVMNVERNGDRKQSNYELYYLSVPDEGLSAEAVRVRAEKEQKSAENVKHKLSKEYTSLEEVFHFLTQKHSFYTSEKLVERANHLASREDLRSMKLLKRSYGGTSKGKNYTSCISIDGSSFTLGTIVGVVSVVLFKVFTARGIKNHPN